MPTFSSYEGPICTFLNRWALPKKSLKVWYDLHARDSYDTNFLYLEGSFDPCLLEDIESAYRCKIEELQRGWQRFCSPKGSADHFLVKESAVVHEPKVIRFLASAFGLMAPHFQCGHLHKEKIHLMVKADQWDRFQKIFRLQIDGEKALK